MPRRIGDHRFQLLLLSTLDETVSRYNIWSATENNMIEDRASVLPGKTFQQLVILNVNIAIYTHTQFDVIEPPIHVLFKTVDAF